MSLYLVFYCYSINPSVDHFWRYQHDIGGGVGAQSIYINGFRRMYTIYIGTYRHICMLMDSCDIIYEPQ